MGARPAVAVIQRIAAGGFGVPDAEPFAKQRVGLGEAIREGYSDQGAIPEVLVFVVLASLVPTLPLWPM